MFESVEMLRYYRTVKNFDYLNWRGWCEICDTINTALKASIQISAIRSNYQVPDFFCDNIIPYHQTIAAEQTEISFRYQVKYQLTSIPVKSSIGPDILLYIELKLASGPPALHVGAYQTPFGSVNGRTAIRADGILIFGCINFVKITVRILNLFCHFPIHVRML